jgi:hypothetical protein
MKRVRAKLRVGARARTLIARVPRTWVFGTLRTGEVQWSALQARGWIRQPPPAKAALTAKSAGASADEEYPRRIK